MKSYIQGLITGAVFVFAFMVFMGASDNNSKVAEVKILDSMSIFKLRDKINVDIKDGWQPQGGIGCSTKAFYQLMTK